MGVCVQGQLAPPMSLVKCEHMSVLGCVAKYEPVLSHEYLCGLTYMVELVMLYETLWIPPTVLGPHCMQKVARVCLRQDRRNPKVRPSPVQDQSKDSGLQLYQGPFPSPAP